jgi:SAM-dependent methyltransferase
MLLADLVARPLPPAPWAEGDNIPWNDPAFSARMLREHLSQEHDAASRRAAVIDRHVEWIDDRLLGGRPAAILDLGCGPGLYTSRLARRGHTCVGVDFSPASIAYARAEAAASGLTCRYELADLRAAEFGSGYDLAMCLFGELNVFRPAHAAGLLRKAHAALVPGGQIVLEAHTAAEIERVGAQPPRWYTAAQGLFGDEPHLVLTEHFWDVAGRAATIRHYVVDLASGAVTRYAESLQAYDEAGYRELLAGCGFGDVEFCPALTGADVPEQPGMFVITARKAAR